MAVLLLRIAAVPGVGSWIQRAGVGGALSLRGAGELQGGASRALAPICPVAGWWWGSLVPVGPPVQPGLAVLSAPWIISVKLC